MAQRVWCWVGVDADIEVTCLRHGLKRGLSISGGSKSFAGVAATGQHGKASKEKGFGDKNAKTGDDKGLHWCKTGK